LEEAACVFLPLRKFLTSSKVSFDVLLVLPEGMELRKAERSSSITADRLLSPRPLKPKTKSSLNVMVTFILRININIP
jgi:UDP-N-acetylglucosamine pyrophosphorylase